MNKEKVIVVGAGVAGIAASYFEAKKGNDVQLLESGDSPGGLLKSVYNGTSYFDFGTHIISETQVAEIDDFLFGDLTDKEHLISKNISPGNYYKKKLNEKSCFVDASTLDSDLYQRACMELLSSKDEGGDNLAEFFENRYGTTIYNYIFKDVIYKYMGVDAETLDKSVGYFFDMSRILAFNQPVVDNLNELELFNKILGHHERKDGLVKYYPRNGGVGALINHLVEKANKAGVILKTKITINDIQYNNKKVNRILTDSGEIECDRLIWSIPLVFLANLAKISRKSIRPVFRNTLLYDFTFNKPLESNSCFINVYEPSLYSGRITLYQNLGAIDIGGYSCTVEALADETISEDEIIKELISMGIVSNENTCLFKQIREIKNGFPLLTTEYTKISRDNNAYYREQFDNVTFIGKASEDAFFMTAVLRDMYNKI